MVFFDLGPSDPLSSDINEDISTGKWPAWFHRTGAEDCGSFSLAIGGNPSTASWPFCLKKHTRITAFCWSKTIIQPIYSYGTSPFLIGNSSTSGPFSIPFSIIMSDYHRITILNDCVLISRFQYRKKTCVVSTVAQSLQHISPSSMGSHGLSFFLPLGFLTGWLLLSLGISTFPRIHPFFLDDLSPPIWSWSHVSLKFHIYIIIYIYIYIWLVVWNIFYFSIYWECHHPNCYSLIFFRGVAQPPTRYIYIYTYTYICHIIRSIKSPSSSWEFLHVHWIFHEVRAGLQRSRCPFGSLGIWENTMKTYKMVI